MSIWVPRWLLNVGVVVGVVVAWESLKAFWRWWNTIGEKMGWRGW